MNLLGSLPTSPFCLEQLDHSHGDLHVLDETAFHHGHSLDPANAAVVGSQVADTRASEREQTSGAATAAEAAVAELATAAAAAAADVAADANSPSATVHTVCALP